MEWLACKMPLSHHPVNLSERFFGDKLVTTHPSLRSIAFTALAGTYICAY